MRNLSVLMFNPLEENISEPSTSNSLAAARSGKKSKKIKIPLQTMLGLLSSKRENPGGHGSDERLRLSSVSHGEQTPVRSASEHDWDIVYEV